ncbi:MAG TPA: sulfite exporter TauE/SafE family protein [Dehalococcoidia bacterium]|nr:sulfite exporter TauE/SafE family protein [Dehalococcoidia bacterium]
MLEYAALAVLGVVVGAFGTLVGAGGGFLLVPVLLFLYPDRDADTITAMSLLVVLANAASGSAAYAWQRRVDFHSGGWFALATLPGSVAGALLVGFVPRQAFDIVFALVLAGVGAFLLTPRRGVTAVRDPLTGPGVVRRMMRDRDGHTYVYAYRRWQGLAISLGVGFVSSLLGIGGGIVHVPAMAIVLHFPVHIAAATSHFVLAVTALEATGTHVLAGSLRGEPMAQALAIALGAVGGAQVGARLSTRVHGPLIIRALGAALVLVALRLGAAAIWA